MYVHVNRILCSQHVVLVMSLKHCTVSFKVLAPYTHQHQLKCSVYLHLLSVASQYVK